VPRVEIYFMGGLIGGWGACGKGEIECAETPPPPSGVLPHRKDDEGESSPNFSLGPLAGGVRQSREGVSQRVRYIRKTNTPVITRSAAANPNHVMA
jgi:hypothetical protein